MADFKTKFKYMLLVGIVIIFAFRAPSASAYSQPTESYYAKVTTAELGNITIYVPYNLGRYFTTDTSGGLISTYSSTISTWGQSVSGSQYDIRFTFSSVPQYKTNSTGYSYADLTITGIRETNIPLLSDTDFTLFSQSTIVNMMMLLVGGSILLFVMIKR